MASVEQPATSKTTVYLPEPLKERIEREALVQRRSLNAQIVRTLEQQYPEARDMDDGVF